MGPLIDAEELSTRLDEVHLFDIRWALTDATKGRATYEKGHIPGAVFVDLDIDLSAPPGPGRHPLPEPSVWGRTLGRLGVADDDEVVVYDDTNGTIAARMWWMLRAIGHESSRLLDGGYQVWVASGGAVERGRNDPEPVEYPPVGAFAGVVGSGEVPGRVLVDARAPERYRGDHEPVDPKAGHIPGALNLPNAVNLDGSGRFLDSPALQAIYSGLGSKPVMSCGSGVNACHNAIAMVLAGLEMPDIYIGSFSEWSRLGLPVVTGDQP